MAPNQSRLSLPEVEKIVEQDAEMRQILVDMSRRQAGGASKGGRYNKHDTARLRFIRDKALMGLRLGILVPDADLRMLRLEPQEQLRQRVQVCQRLERVSYEQRGTRQRALLCWHA
jgi:hypothetical protein